MEEYQKFSYHDLEKFHRAVSDDSQYGEEERMLERIMRNYPKNNDLDIIAMKVSVVDLTNSTQLSNYKSKISLYDISKIILDFHIDEDLKNGNPEIVHRLAEACKNFKKNNSSNGVNLFSFASKYCAYHNMYAYGRDDFSIFDNVVSSNLYRYSTEKNPLRKMTPEIWRQNCDYEAYNQYIGALLDEKGINADNYPRRRRMFDHFVWYSNRTTNQNY